MSARAALTGVQLAPMSARPAIQDGRTAPIQVRIVVMLAQPTRRLHGVLLRQQGVPASLLSAAQLRPGDLYLVMRLDGPNVRSVIAAIDRAQHIRIDQNEALIVFDANLGGVKGCPTAHRGASRPIVHPKPKAVGSIGWFGVSGHRVVRPVSLDVAR